MSRKLVCFAVVAVIAVVCMGSSASAEALLTFATRAGNISGTSGQFIALNSAGATTLFFTSTTILLKITYNAECGALGSGGWTSVRIFVDGIEANPVSGTSFAFCTAEGSAFHWVGADRLSFITRPTGVHSVRVFVQNISSSTWWLGDSTIVVEQR
jgi:hypothetical protein